MRSHIIQSVRSFFDHKNYLEVDTPLLSPTLIPESCLEVFRTDRIPYVNSKKIKPYWLIPSPEIWMKKLIASHKRNIYQICKSFRNGESCGNMHSPEFTMLEYYTMNVSYIDSIKITEDLVDNILCNTQSGFIYYDDANYKTIEPPFLRMSMDEAFSLYAGFSLNDAIKRGTLYDEAIRLGLDVLKDTKEELLYNLIFIDKVENALPSEKPVVLLDYPAIVRCLAASVEGEGGVLNKERWELYIHGIEAANCFSEETDALRVKDFFEDETNEKNKNAIVKHDVDSNYYKIFEDFPICSGVALGMDRLIMAVCGRKTIDGVLSFPMKDNNE
ncbi:MAG: tRNA synthetase, class II [Termitinemataceae bacterium]|nr:MAG: tRNA synthetase, class II [Termitinemataceae bacterium]